MACLAVTPVRPLNGHRQTMPRIEDHLSWWIPKIVAWRSVHGSDTIRRVEVTIPSPSWHNRRVCSGSVHWSGKGKTKQQCRQGKSNQ